MLCGEYSLTFIFRVGDHENFLIIVLTGLLQKTFLNVRVSFLDGKRKTDRYLLPEARPVVGSTREDPREVHVT